MKQKRQILGQKNKPVGLKRRKLQRKSPQGRKRKFVRNSIFAGLGVGAGIAGLALLKPKTGVEKKAVGKPPEKHSVLNDLSKQFPPERIAELTKRVQGKTGFFFNGLKQNFAFRKKDFVKPGGEQGGTVFWNPKTKQFIFQFQPDFFDAEIRKGFQLVENGNPDGLKVLTQSIIESPFVSKMQELSPDISKQQLISWLQSYCQLKAQGKPIPKKELNFFNVFRKALLNSQFNVGALSPYITRNEYFYTGATPYELFCTFHIHSPFKLGIESGWGGPPDKVDLNATNLIGPHAVLRPTSDGGMEAYFLVNGKIAAKKKIQ